LRQYRLYELDYRSRVFKPAIWIDADNDSMATEVATALLDERAIEIWEGRRIVSCLKPDKRKRVSVAN
jgi:hydroxylamine reductase (hybrid-cluster protein)